MATPWQQQREEQLVPAGKVGFGKASGPTSWHSSTLPAHGHEGKSRQLGLFLPSHVLLW